MVKKSIKKGIKKGTKYVCRSCGLVVTVDNACGCAESHEIMCCNENMKPKKVKV
jgi:hypothetical protein